MKAKHPQDVKADQAKKELEQEKQEEKERQEQYKKSIEKEAESVKIRRDPQLLINIIKEIQKNVAGEEDTIVAVTMVATLRLVKDAAPESKNLFLSDTTGVGKDFTTKKILEVIVPPKDLLHVTKMSNEAFTYWHANENDWEWDKKVIHFEDVTEPLLNGSTFKVMASGGSHAIVVKDQKTIEIPIKGKPCMIPTSHHTNLEDESLRRFPIGSLDNSLDQTIRIKNKISKKYSGEEQEVTNEILCNTIQNLFPCSVIIPFAEMIQFFFPDDILMRTHYRRFLDYIRASAVFHQYQRKKTKDGKLIAEPDDYMIARMVLIYTTSNPKMIPVSKEYRDLLCLLQENKEPMIIREIGVVFGKDTAWLYRNLPKLVETGLIKKGEIFDERANKGVTTYQYDPGQNPNAIPTWNEIQKKIDKIIEKTAKTAKTTPKTPLEKWFSHNKIQLRKPKNDDERGGFSLVVAGHEIPFNREVVSVFAVLSSFLRERDEKRYKRYYEVRPAAIEATSISDFENSSDESKNRNKTQHQRMNDLKAYLQREVFSGCGASTAVLYDNFLASDVDQAIQSNILIRLPNGNYKWSG